MAEDDATTPLYPGDILDKETFNHLQLSAFFMMLVNESNAGESRGFELLRRLVDNGLTPTALKKGDPKEDDDTDDAYCIPANDLMEVLAEAENRWKAELEIRTQQWANDDEIWNIDQIWKSRVRGVPDGCYTKLGTLWVSEDDYREACTRLGATSYRWPKYPWSTELAELIDKAVPTRGAIPTAVPIPTLKDTVQKITSTRRQGHKAKIIREIVGIILNAAERHIPGFDRHNIPGTCKEMLQFCQALDSTLFDIIPNTFRYYVKGTFPKYKDASLCSWIGKGEPPWAELFNT